LRPQTADGWQKMAKILNSHRFLSRLIFVFRESGADNGKENPSFRS
jgi:hypothetical protein